MDVFNSFATDEAVEVAGVWKDLDKDTSILVARMENKEHTKLMIKLYEENISKLEGNPELDDILTREILAKTILKGWKNLTYKGKTLKYSIDNAMMILSHKDFRKAVVKIAIDFDNFRMKLDEEDVKN